MIVMYVQKVTQAIALMMIKIVMVIVLVRHHLIVVVYVPAGIVIM